MRRSKTSHLLENWLSLRFRLFLEGILIGLLTGLVVVFYRLLLMKSEYLRSKLYSLMQSGLTWTIPFWFLALILMGLLLGWITRKEPLLGGSGIPQVKGILWGRIKANWPTLLIGKIFTTVLAIGSGLSLGRGAPSIQIGASLAQGTSRLLGRLRIEEKYLITCGASAGLAAAFNAPLAGAIFAIEEMHKNLSPILMSSAIAASLAADLVSQHFFSQQPIFFFPDISTLPLEYYPYLLLLGIFMGLLGVLFNRGLQKSLDFYHKSGINPVFRPVLPFIAAGILGFFLPQILGGGENLVNELGTVDFLLPALLILAGGKFIFTLFCYGSGVPGGIFLPMLVTGALLGNIFGLLFTSYAAVDPHYLHNFIVYAMAAFLTAIIKAPITGSILLTEMAGSFTHLLATLTVSMTAYLVSDLLRSQPIYEVLLNRLMRKEGWVEYKAGEQRHKSVFELPVCLGSFLDRKRVRDITWPEDCLLVGIRRGETEVIPKGNTLIHVGDQLVVLVDEEKESAARDSLLKLTGDCQLKK